MWMYVFAALNFLGHISKSKALPVPVGTFLSGAHYTYRYCPLLILPAHFLCIFPPWVEK